MAYARPFTHTASTQPSYSEIIGSAAEEYIFISAPEAIPGVFDGYFSDFTRSSGFEWWNGPDESEGYIIGVRVATFDHPTPDGNIGNVKFWRTQKLSESSFLALGNRILGTTYSIDKDLWFALSKGTGIHWTSYKYSIFIGGLFNQYLLQDHNNFAVIRSTDGQLDPHTGGTYDYFSSGFSDEVSDIYHRTDGRMLVSGSFTQSLGTNQANLVQLGSDGVPDGIIREFDAGVIQSIANEHRDWDLGSSGGSNVDIVAVGGFTSYDSQTANYVVSINSDGSKNSQFNSGFDNIATCIDADKNHFYIGGYFSDYDGNSCSYLAMIDKDSSSLTLDIGGYVGLDANPEAIRLTKDELYLLVVGQFSTPNNGIMKWEISSSTYSSTFGDFNGPPLAVDFLSDGSIIVGGVFTTYGLNICNRICKLSATGSFDTAFATNIGTGFDTIVLDLRVLPDDTIVVGGYFTQFNGVTASGIAKIGSDGIFRTEWESDISFSSGYVTCVSPR